MIERGPIRVLVVDDSEFFAEMTAKTLETEHGFETFARKSAHEGIEFLADERVDCIVSDYEMPEQNGLKFLETVRETVDEEIPFLLLTGRGDEEVASEAIASGVDDYFLKLNVVEDEEYGRLANRIRSVVSENRAQQKYELLVTSSPDGVAHVASDGTVLTANPSLAATVGSERETVIGSTLPQVFGDVGNERLETGRAVIADGKPKRSEDVYEGKHFHNIFVPVDFDSDHDTFQLISRDITEQKERERELQRQNERLEKFASVVSHDLRNPLGVARGSAQLIADECDETDAVDRMDRALTRMDRLIDDVLTLARQGKAAHQPDAVDLAHIAEEAWASVRTESARIDIADSGMIEADPGRLQELLENLFNNAVTHGAEDVTVRVGVADRDGFYVEDDGPGIPSDRREEVFELGYSTADDGTGMGLSIVQQIASAHGWDSEITDGRDGGTRFVFTDVTFLE
ncbi:response regulator [Halorhabdus sp. CBA1104]|uniref:sensor histidine kinase n=1 Tax=Halorhabdus sp. CBA1104 TaxID=1380432 RepID=UPI0012B3AF56|nr:ATP-binding protein [Halorhabdus sp. CBA1104]QGN06205.1 response regulator [Halorhabdus sp. CBA1104]